MPSPEANRPPTWSDEPDRVEDLRVDLPRALLARRRVREAQEVEVRAVVAGVADLASCEGGLKRERAGERHRHVRVRRRLQAVVHDLGDEPRHAQELGGQRARIGQLRAPIVDRAWCSGVLRPVVLGHGDRDLVGLVAGDARGDPLDLARPGAAAGIGWLTWTSAARISPSLIPTRRMAPPRRANVAFLWPAGMGLPFSGMFALWRPVRARGRPGAAPWPVPPSHPGWQ